MSNKRRFRYRIPIVVHLDADNLADAYNKIERLLTAENVGMEGITVWHLVSGGNTQTWKQDRNTGTMTFIEGPEE